MPKSFYWCKKRDVNFFTFFSLSFFFMRQDQKANQLERGDNPMRVFDNDKVEVYDQTNFSIEDIPDSAIESTQSGQPTRGLSARHIQMISLGGCIG